MVIPTYQEAMLPILLALKERGPLRARDLAVILTDNFHLTRAERNRRIPSGFLFVIQSRVGWALAYLKRAGLVLTPVRGTYDLTARGASLLRTHPSSLNTRDLLQYAEVREFMGRKDLE